MLLKLLAFLYLSLFALAANAQPILDPQKPEDAEKLRKQVVEFLRDTLTEINYMRTLENRISFTSEIASLLWFHDEREARRLYTGVINDFQNLLREYDAQMNALGIAEDDEPVPVNFLDEMTERARLERKFRTALAVRQQIALNIAEHDPDLALSFYSNGLSIISNPAFLKQVQANDMSFETQLLARIAEKDPAKAAKAAMASLKEGLSYNHIELLKKLYQKDPSQAADFAQAILGQARSGKYGVAGYHILNSLLSFGAEALDNKKAEQKPPFTQAELREIAEVLAQAVLAEKDTGPGAMFDVTTIEKFQPGRAAQIRAKFGGKNNELSDVYASNIANVAVSGPGGITNSNSNTSPYQKQQQEREAAEKRITEDAKKLASKELSKEERERIVREARRLIAKTPGRGQKITALSMLATQVARSGDKELAAELMREASSFVNPDPKNYQDFMLSWMLAAGYSSADPDKAFPLLQHTIGRANELIDAFIRVGEFMDVAEEAVADGELQVGAFGGGMIRGLTSELGMADALIQSLAKHDFGKTRVLTNQFHRTEVRVLAKMMVARALLKPKSTEAELKTVVSVETNK